MALSGGDILYQSRHTALQPLDVRREGAELAPGQVLLVGMVLLEDREALQLRVRLRQRQHGGVAGGDGLHLSVGQLLGANVLGPPDAAVAGEHLGDEPGFGFERLPEVGIERALRDVSIDRNNLVHIILTQNPAVALLHLGGFPGRIDMV
jgi:hypothetical protein